MRSAISTLAIEMQHRMRSLRHYFPQGYKLKMKPAYTDITEKLGSPLWWDEYGVPRYVDFHPRFASCIYAQQVLLLEIGCQTCDRLMLVEVNGGILQGDMARAVRDHKICYGDPPSHGDHSGETMSSEVKRVVQFWNRVNFDWQREPELEIVFTE